MKGCAICMKFFGTLLHALEHLDLKYYSLEACSFVFAVQKVPDPPLTDGFGARLFILVQNAKSVKITKNKQTSNGHKIRSNDAI